MLRLLYSLLFYCAVPFVLLRLLWRSRREPLYRAALAERFGFCPPVKEEDLVWVHAVSAGETNAAAGLIERLLERGFPVLVTNMTPTGRERVETLFGERVHRCYAPYDMPDAVSRFLGRARPAVLVVVDTEMWPNTIHHAHRAGVGTLLVNARMSVKSARGYRLIGGLTRAMLGEFDHIAVQTPAHGERFVALGLSRDKLTVAGSVKFDATLPDDIEFRRRQLKGLIGNHRVIVAASTHAGEEELLLDALRSMDDDVLMVLAPRHPHRAPEVSGLCDRRGFDLVRRSENRSCDAGTRVFLLDTMGELIYFYAIADVAFVGGSLVPTGGHNPMEPAMLGVPFVMGPHLRNIEDITAIFLEAGGMAIVNSADDARREFNRLLEDDAARTRQVECATKVMASNRGALDRIEKLVVERIRG